ncbi:sigma-70 family RNA polymerase sigma factor [Peribacillus frigoritolerans]|uniref:sigma-70 family RNA polymerase sigma factor n=1 Tax=Peribacillus frigoritolerans TaxID=450367 RepID=UPI0021635673|nr:sigma-70 family RNA polymerase sigma factor [Peribacillus frigoritolerans]
MKIEKLITKARRGDKKAFLRLIESEQTKLYRTAFIYTKNKDDALDIVQETVYKALNSISSLKETKYYSTWLTKILINTSLDYLKKKKKLVLVDYDLGESVPDKELEIDYSIDLYHAIDQLNDRHKTIVILRYYQDLTIKQIAELLETPEGTIKSNLHRAIKMLKATLEGDCINE